MFDRRGAARAEAARAIQVWAYPLVFAQRVRLNFVQPLAPTTRRPPTSAGAPLNTFGHQRRLSDPTLTVGVAPNVDTLYSVAWLDVRHNRFVLKLPEVGARYASFQLALQDTSTPITVSTPAPGGRFPTISIASGTDSLAVTDERVELRTSWRYIMVVGRILVEPDSSDAELAAVHQLQDEIELQRVPIDDPPSPTEDHHLAHYSRADETTRPHVFAHALKRVLCDAGDTVVDGALRRTLTHSRLLEDSWDSETLGDLGRGLQHGLRDIADHITFLGRHVNGWAVNESGVDFDGDDLLRAAVAHSQIFINPASEALYPMCEVDADGRPLDGSMHSYRLTFDAGSLPPVNAFWSLTAYHAQGLLVANEVRRYAIGDRTPGLSYGPDGSLTIDIGAQPPRMRANWLPVPPSRFRLMLRLYRPTAVEWDPPPVVAQPR